MTIVGIVLILIFSLLFLTSVPFIVYIFCGDDYIYIETDDENK